jgi:hypothetical protein
MIKNQGYIMLNISAKIRFYFQMMIAIILSSTIMYQSVASEVQIDQQNNVPFTNALNANVVQQTITSGITGTLESIEFAMQVNRAAEYTVTATILNGLGGTPIAIDTFVYNATGGSNLTATFDFTGDNIVIEQGEQFSVSFSWTSPTASTEMTVMYDSGDSYTAGALYYVPNLSIQGDAIFTTFVTVLNAGQVDQQNSVPFTNAQNPNNLQQTITPGVTGILERVEFDMFVNRAAEYTITATILDGLNGLPIASDTFVYNATGGSNLTTVFDFIGDNVLVEQGEQFAVSFSWTSPTASTDMRVYYNNGDFYTEGDLYFVSSSSSSIQGDAIFTTFVTALNAGQVDQQNSVPFTNAQNPNNLQQTITPGVTGILERVEFDMFVNRAAEYTITATILDGLNGLPIASDTFIYNATGGSNLTTIFDFIGDNVLVEQGEQFAVSFSWTSPTASTDMRVYYNNGDLYTGGDLYSVPNLSIQGDAIFTTFMTVTNEPPTSAAGIDQSARLGDTVTLDGTSSFDDNTLSTNLFYSWTLTSIPLGSNAELDTPMDATPSFEIDVLGAYEAELVVTDEGGLSSIPDTVIVSINNLAPTSDAGNDQLVIVGTGEQVLLDGSGSTDPENDTLTYHWIISLAPINSTATLSGVETVSPSFYPDVEGLYQITLIVSDQIGVGTSDMVEITGVVVEEYAQIQILELDESVVSLDAASGEVTTAGNQNAYSNFLSQAILSIQEDDIVSAVSKLQKALIRTDGCVLRGEPDSKGASRDWITDCDVQTELYYIITNTIDSLIATN